MELTEIRDLLLDCLHQDPKRLGSATLKQLSDSEWELLREQAVMQKVSALLYQRLKALGQEDTAPDTLVHRLRDRYRYNSMRNLYLSGELRQIANSLKGENVPIIALKGIHLAHVIYDSIGLREMKDIDLLVPARGITRTVEVLNAMGYQAMRPFSIEAELAAHLHLPSFFKPGAAIEIHWNITKPGEHYSIQADELWERAAPTAIAGTDIFGLSGEDLLLHLCLHTSYQHRFEFGLRPSCDIAETVRYFGADLDWIQVQQRAVQWGWSRGTYLALRLARELVGADVPQEVLEELRPPDFDEAFANMARAQLFADRALAGDLGPGVAQVWDSKGLWQKGVLLRRIFSRLLRKLYPVTTDVSGGRHYTRLWIRKLILGRGRAMGRLLRGDNEVTLLLRRRNTLSQWLSHK